MNDMSLYRDTDEMKKLMNKVRPYFDNRFQLPDDAPEEIKEAFAKYRKLAKEREAFALSL
jgi:hypothetical protein